MKILDILKLTDEEKEAGVWLSGIEGEGEYKEWYEEGEIFKHCFYKNKKKHGEYKVWMDNGRLYNHTLWEDDIFIKDYTR